MARGGWRADGNENEPNQTRAENPGPWVHMASPGQRKGNGGCMSPITYDAAESLGGFLSRGGYVHLKGLGQNSGYTALGLSPALTPGS